jgi:RHS repeat-associated protein
MWMPVQNFGWRAQTEVTTGYISYQTGLIKCYDTPPGFYWDTTYLNFQYHDSFGAVHSFNLPTLASCSTFQHSAKINTYDGSGYTISATDGPSATIIAKTGQILNPPLVVGTGSGGVIDANGNEISVSGSTFTDTLGVTALTVSGTNPMKFNYTAPSGATASYSVSYVMYTVATAFGISGITDYPKTSIALVDKITLPDTTFYQFKYEATPGTCTPLSGTVSCVTGRLKSVAFPTLGTQAASFGTITYTYTGANNGIFSDGSAAGLTRVTPDGTWTYTRTLGTAPASTTTVTDPPGNQTKIQFQGIYETQRQTYTGTVSSGTLLQSVNTCYNSSASPCTSTAVVLPIVRRTAIDQYGSTGLKCEYDYHYDPTSGLLTERDDYDYGTSVPATPIRKVLITYAALGNGIVSAPHTVTVEEGAGTVKSQTTYTYDQGTPVTTSSPQHVAVSGSRGNPTTIAHLVQGSTSLTQTATYFDTGNVQTSTDVNGAQTTFTYGNCGNAFVTNVAEPLSLSRSATWNCTGGIQLTAKDENTAQTTNSYTDAYFWRPHSITDPTSAVTTYSYGSLTSLGQAYTESTLPFNSGSSSVDVVQIVDGLGRPIETQKRQAPGSSNFDSVLGGYDSSGRFINMTQPYQGTLGQNCCGAPDNTSSFDSLNRLTLATDAFGGTTSYTYYQNDVLVTVGPAPTGENTKRRQLEYDSLGRIKSVCEITSLPGSGACGQTVGYTGYLTTYMYDATGNLLNVTQNAQPSGTSQTRTYTYDLMGRLTAESNPENEVLIYTYETDPGCGISAGDVVKRTDSVQNQVCYAYDALHRITSVLTYGPYASVTSSKFFVYDTATVNSVGMLNAKTRLAEAYTSSSPTGSPKLTDTGFSYSSRGESLGEYQSTPNSGGYYVTYQSYWANEATYQIAFNVSGFPSLITYGVDGEGRQNSTSASSGQNPITSVLYNATSQPYQVNFGSSDSDAFGYDPNTGRMTQYQFNVNGNALVGSLTWNPNASLQKLVISDAFNATDSQTCNYNHDDLSRISTANCGAIWGQTFTYDAFGNITKTVIPGSAGNSFQPTYSSSTNRITAISGFTPTYDHNGNVLNDNSHIYAMDADNKAVTIDGIGVTYDAMDRMVEQNRSGAHTQIVYAATGEKFALMSGQTLQKAFVPLPGGGTAVYNGSGLLYYGHSDHLGSIRVGSTTTRTVSFDLAYAPFGETYAPFGSTDSSFTGQRQDTSTGLYDFLAREYSNQGRWPSPDPAGLGAVDLSVPQSWNRYGYTTNDPVDLNDPFGLCSIAGLTTKNKIICRAVAIRNGGPLGGILWINETGTNWDTFTTYGTWQFFPEAGPATFGATIGGYGKSLLSMLKKAVSAACTTVADAGSIGVGADAGIGIAGAGQLNVTANGVSGQLTLSGAMGFSAGAVLFDAYLSSSNTSNAPDNGFLDSHGQPSKSTFWGVERVGLFGGDGTYGATYGPSLSPVSFGQQFMSSKPLVDIPYLGYAAQPARAICLVVTGH